MPVSLRKPASAAALHKAQLTCSSHTLMPCLPCLPSRCHCQCGRCMLVTAAHASVQVFGNDSVLGRGNETAESTQQWLDDVDMPVSLRVKFHA